MVVGNDVLNQIVNPAPKVKPINVKDMAEVGDVLNLIVNPVPKVKPINA